MTFEGSQVNIPIKGIMRAGTDNLCADGAMNEVIGMEYKDGSWLPYMLKEEGVTFPSQSFVASKPYLHKTSDGESHYVFLDQTDSSNTRLYYETGRNGGTITAALLTTHVLDLEFVGNMLCVATDTGMEYYIWKDGAYEQKAMPSMDISGVSIRVTSGFKYEEDTLLGVTYDSSYKEIDAPSGNPNWNIVKKYGRELIQSNVIAALGEVRDKGGLTGYALGCVAYRMKNGSLVAASSPMLLSCPMAKYNSSQDGFRETCYNDQGELTEDFALRTGATGAPGTKKIYQKSNTSSITASTYVFINRDADMEEGAHEVLYDAENHHCKYRASTYAFNLQCVAGGRVQVNPGELLVYTSDVQIPQLLATVITDSTRDSDYNREWKFCAYAAGNGLEYKVEDASVIEDLRSKDIESVCFFLTEQVSPFIIKDKLEDYEKMFINGGTMNIWQYVLSEYSETTKLGQSLFVSRRSEASIIEELKKLNSFYLVGEVVLDSLAEAGTWTPIELSGKLGDALVVREQLPLTAFDNTLSIPSHIDSYNYRLHAFDYTQELFKGFSLSQFGYHGGTGQYEETVLPHTTTSTDLIPIIQTYKYKWEIKVNLKNDNGESIVVNYDDNELEELRLSLSPVITYPSKEAYSFTIRAYKTSDRLVQYVVYEETHNFSHDWNLGMSFYVDPELKPILPSTGNYEDVEPYPTPVTDL